LGDCAPLGELGPHLTQCGLRRGLPPCQVSSRSPNATVDELFDTYDCTLTNVADQFAPERTVTPRLRPLCPWFDAEWCRAIRRNCRRLERRYRRTRDAQDKAAYVATSTMSSTRRRSNTGLSGSTPTILCSAVCQHCFNVTKELSTTSRQRATTPTTSCGFSMTRSELFVQPQMVVNRPISHLLLMCRQHCQHTAKKKSVS